MTRKIVSTASVSLLFIALAVVARLVPHPPNFTPVASVALFAGFYFRHRAVAVCVPIVAMLASDAIIGMYDWRVTAVVYAAIALPVFLRSLLRGRYFLPRLAACTSLCSIVFFLATNLAVWAFGPHYPQTAAGLIQCYAAALPFFKYTLGGDLFWTGMLFGTYALARWFSGSLQGSLEAMSPVKALETVLARK